MTGRRSRDEAGHPEPEGWGGERVRDAMTAQPDKLDGLLSFLSRLGRFGLVAGTPPLLTPLNPVE